MHLESLAPRDPSGVTSFPPWLSNCPASSNAPLHPPFVAPTHIPAPSVSQYRCTPRTTLSDTAPCPHLHHASTTASPRPLQGAYGHAHPLQVPPLYAHRPQGSHLRPRPHGALFWSSEATPLFPPSTALSPQTTAPATPPSLGGPAHSLGGALAGGGRALGDGGVDGQRR